MCDVEDQNEDDEDPDLAKRSRCCLRTLAIVRRDGVMVLSRDGVESGAMILLSDGWNRRPFGYDGYAATEIFCGVTPEKLHAKRGD